MSAVHHSPIKPTSVVSSDQLNPKSKPSEFSGPAGTAILVPIIPTIIYGLHFSCNEVSGGCPPSVGSIPFYAFKSINDLNWWKSLWDTQAFLAYLGWIAYMVLAWCILPGDWIDGTQLRDGTKKQYKINAFSTLLLTVGLTTGVIVRGGPESFTWVYNHWVGLMTASVLCSTFQSIVLYIWSFRGGDPLLALGGNSDSHIYNFWMGRELNPSIGSLDLCTFYELRPGLIGWVIINISMACEQATRLDGQITDSMILILIFQGLYVVDALYNEPALLTTMDITTDGLGYMLTIGHLAWVPSVYSLQAKYLAFNPISLGPFWTFAIFTLNALGFWIFRSSNNEKDQFRQGNNPKNLIYMTTSSGRKLLISGWWGWLQHPNYLGDLLMTLAWCAATGTRSPIPYFQLVYFTILLIHRQMRDDDACEEKYGKDWEIYKRLVPYKILPYIY